MRRRVAGLVVVLGVLALGVFFWSSRSEEEGHRLGRVGSSQGGGGPERTTKVVEDRRALEESTPSGSLLVRVTNQQKQPVAGAALYLGDDEEVTAVGVTDDDGRLLHSESRQSFERLVAVADGYVKKEVVFEEAVDLTESLEKEVHLSLENGSSIVGRVIDTEGRPLNAIRVLAWLCGEEYPVDRADSWLHDPTVPLALTDSEGRFEIPGVDPSKWYELTAGGQGWYSKKPRARVRSDSGPCVLDVVPVYGVLCKIVADVAPSFQVFNSRNVMRWSMKDETANSLGDGGPFWSLLGITVNRSRLSRFDKLFVYSGDSSLPKSLGPIRWLFTIPGYESANVEVWADRLIDSVPEFEVSVSRNELALGELGVHVVAPDIARLADASAEELLGILHLRPSNDDPIEGMSYEMRVHCSVQEQVIRGIPFGEYEAYFQSLSKYFYFPGPFGLRPVPVPLNIGSTRAQLNIDLLSTGTVVLIPTWSDGEEIRGELLVKMKMLVQGGQDWPAFTSLASPPYVIRCLPAATYEVSAQLRSNTQGNARGIWSRKVQDLAIGETERTVTLTFDRE